MLLYSSPSLNSFLFNSNSNSNFLSKNHKSLKSVPQTLRVVNNNDVDAFTEKSGYLFELSSSEADSLNDYDLKKIAAIYKRKPFILLRRLFQIGSTFGRWLAARYIDSITEKSDLMFKIRAAELRQILLELGPAYIKIAQAVSSRPVYQARLRSNGQVVAVKVQRPGVQAAISLDILILHFMAGVVKKAGRFNSDLQAVVDEWASSLFREMDYIKEAKNGLKFRELYGGIEDVLVPYMYLENTTRRVLVMEWVEGKKLSEVKDLYLVEVGVYCSFNQLLEYGFYHADPHPGNLLRTYNGKLAYIDFGMMGEFNQEFRDGFIEACLHLVNRDFDALAKDFVTLGFLPPTSDKEGVTKALTGVFQNAVAKGVSNISFGDLLGNLGTTMYKLKFQIPSYFSLVIRSVAVLEGIAIGFNPNYKVLGSTYPWIARKVLTDSSPQLRSSLQALLYEKGVFRIDRLESLLSESLRARTEKALVKSQLEDNDSKVAVKQILSFTLTEKGAFVREILLQEIAKGLDAFGLATLDYLTSMANTSIPFAASSSSSMTEEDMMNLRTFRRLMLILSGFQKNGGSPVELKRTVPSKNQNMYSEEASLIFYQFPSVEEILPILSVFPELPPELQQQLLLLPADLAGRLISRVTARTIRRVFL
ncbi:uncharacterized aarF domain-containing protein kinase At1g71810, chloroplastic isoform X2 [Populus alba]|uniref:uncharacterized aarF domain-containing protein kinase At1g71810, chloroplastic isoform X2 n=1 Tax=Populus alba TaxID=43335 RepID=UPI003CC78EAA